MDEIKKGNLSFLSKEGAMKLSQDEESQLIERIRKNPQLARCLLEMTDIIGKDLEKIDLADDAEEIVVTNIRKTGKELLTN